MSHSDLQKGHRRAHDAHYALPIFRSVFASVENKGLLGYIPKLKVASSSLVARSIFLTNRIEESLSAQITNHDSDRKENEQFPGLSLQNGS
jgi:hypothetical protein